MRRVVFIFCWLSFISLFFACSRKPSDDVIARDIETKVSADPETQDSQVAAESKQGNVKWARAGTNREYRKSSLRFSASFLRMRRKRQRGIRWVV